MKPKTQKCEHCEIGRTVVEMADGYRVHRIKQSNGVDYDWYEVPCHIQTKKGMTAYKRQSLAFVTQRIVEARGKLAKLEANAALIKNADHPNNVFMALERLKSV